MSISAATSNIPETAPAARAQDLALSPLECLFDTVFTYLLPIFLTHAGGDIRVARQSIIDLLDAYQAATAAELVLVAQIISFSHAAMDSLSRAMTPDLPERLVLRFRGNASALNRSAEQCRKALSRMQANRPEPGHSLAEPWSDDVPGARNAPVEPAVPEQACIGPAPDQPAETLPTNPGSRSGRPTPETIPTLPDAAAPEAWSALLRLLPDADHLAAIIPPTVIPFTPVPCHPPGA